MNFKYFMFPFFWVFVINSAGAEIPPTENVSAAFKGVYISSTCMLTFRNEGVQITSVDIGDISASELKSGVTLMQKKGGHYYFENTVCKPDVLSSVTLMMSSSNCKGESVGNANAEGSKGVSVKILRSNDSDSYNITIPLKCNMPLEISDTRLITHYQVYTNIRIPVDFKFGIDDGMTMGDVTPGQFSAAVTFTVAYN